MATLRRRAGHDDATPEPLDELVRPTSDELPDRRMGGQELPDDVQDRPEQNAGYDAAVHGTRDQAAGADDGDVLDVALEDAGAEVTGRTAAAEAAESIDLDAERDVVAEVRRRERSNR
jgi:hypothetical protein